MQDSKKFLPKGDYAKFFILLLIVMSLVTACVPVLKETPQPITPSGNITDALAAQKVVEEFLSAWQAEDYPSMYAQLTTLCRDAMTLEEFESIYRDAASSLTLQTISFDLLSAMAAGTYVEVSYRLHFTTMLAGDLTREMMVNLTQEENDWRIHWEIGLILPELRGGNHLEFVHQIPSRGRIYAQNGAPLAAYEDAISIGLVPGEIVPEQADLIFKTLAEISYYDAEELAQWVESTQDDWYLPVISLSQEDVKPYMENLRDLSGVRIDEFRSRFYVDGGVAPHVLGYMTYIPEEELEAYLRLGYRQDERVGATGLEGAFEAELSGKRGGSLYVVSPDGEIQSLLASNEPQPGESLFTTLDKELQMRLQDSLGDLRAAVVVMEVNTGRVLALVSNPAFDPNAFDLMEIDRSLLDSYFIDEDRPLFNRATQGQYPLGSVFKIITMSTALEKNLYEADSTFNCGSSLWVCDSLTMYDWTYWHGTVASGLLTLQEGLMRSCNPWFYHIGENLYEEEMDQALSEMAYGFGLGAATGIDIPEASGNIPEKADTCVENAQLAIGQGEILVTPLQVASFMAAMANGGTLYRPALVQKIVPASGGTTYTFSPTVNGKLPITDETRRIVLEALRMVVAEPSGTGFSALQGLEIIVYGKTGTAETPSGNSHAWFAGFTQENDPEKPDIAVAVIVENGGEGSYMAAPIFRRAVSLYFSNNADPSGLMPWEEVPYVPQQPTPTPTPTSPSED